MSRSFDVLYKFWYAVYWRTFILYIVKNSCNSENFDMNLLPCTFTRKDAANQQVPLRLRLKKCALHYGLYSPKNFSTCKKNFQLAKKFFNFPKNLSTCQKKFFNFPKNFSTFQKIFQLAKKFLKTSKIVLTNVIFFQE